MNNIITQEERICNFLHEKNLDFLPKIPNRHIVNLIIAATEKGYSGKTTEMEEYSTNHRTTISHFLSKGKWDETLLEKAIQRESLNFIEETSMLDNKTIYLSVDDTVSNKKKPSSQATRPMQGTGFHHSHLQGKQVWGHQIQVVTIGNTDTKLCYQVKRYNKEESSKIQNVIDMANALPMAKSKSYALFDSWYTCPKIIDAFEKKGYYTIAALKTNRIIYPQGIRISIEEFAEKYIDKNDVDLVTVKGNDYLVYRYEGALNGIPNAVVLMSYPKNAFKKPGALRAFICTDTEASTVEILEHYSERWDIEVFIKQQKTYLGFNKYQIRNIKGIERFWLIMSLAHLYCVIGVVDKYAIPFGKGLRIVRQKVKFDMAKFIYKSAIDGMPFNLILKAVNL